MFAAAAGAAGSDAGTDRDLDEDEWASSAADLGAEARDVDTLFEAMAHGYDSDEIGELDEDDPRIFDAPSSIGSVRAEAFRRAEAGAVPHGGGDGDGRRERGRVRPTGSRTA